MTKAEIVALVQDVARDQAEDETIDIYYDEVIEELGRSSDPPMATYTSLSTTSGVSSYAFPADCIKILYMFYDGSQLAQDSASGLSANDINWRDSSGDPVCWTVDRQTTDTVRLIPTPDSTSATKCKILYSQERTTNIPDVLVPYIVFRVLYKEFIRPSDHQDVDWAKLFQQVAQLFHTLGVRRRRDEKGTV